MLQMQDQAAHPIDAVFEVPFLGSAPHHLQGESKVIAVVQGWAINLSRGPL